LSNYRINIFFKYLDKSKNENAVEYEVTVRTGGKLSAGTGRFMRYLFSKEKYFSFTIQ